VVRQASGGPANNGGLPNSVNVPGNPVMIGNVSAMNTAETQPAMAAMGRQGATLTVNANVAGADIEVDGMFVGNAHTTIQLAAGVHRLTVKNRASEWQREIQITGGSVTIQATLNGGAAGVRRGSGKGRSEIWKRNRPGARRASPAGCVFGGKLESCLPSAS
jgi:hypothetical protein